MSWDSSCPVSSGWGSREELPEDGFLQFGEGAVPRNVSLPVCCSGGRALPCENASGWWQHPCRTPRSSLSVGYLLTLLTAQPGRDTEGEWPFSTPHNRGPYNKPLGTLFRAPLRSHRAMVGGWRGQVAGPSGRRAGGAQGLAPPAHLRAAAMAPLSLPIPGTVPAAHTPAATGEGTRPPEPCISPSKAPAPHPFLAGWIPPTKSPSKYLLPQS